MPLNPTQLAQAYPFVAEGPFRSHNELTAALASPRYKDDPAYRDDVARKLAQTDRREWGLSDSREPILHTRRFDAVASEGIEW